MPAVFLVSDTHFGHAGVCRFMRNDGVTKLRPWDNPEDMDEAMVKLWNERVRPNDKVYHLGDVVMHRRALSIMSRLNGDKVLIRGNHDIFKDDDYLNLDRYGIEWNIDDFTKYQNESIGKWLNETKNYNSIEQLFFDRFNEEKEYYSTLL